MFDRNAPARPTAEIHSSNCTVIPARPGFTKFEQAAKDFTAAWIVRGETEYNAALAGIATAEAFCAAMEERQK